MKPADVLRALAEVPRLVELLRRFERGVVPAGQCIRVRAERQAERLEIDRSQIAGVLSTVLANHAIQDVSVEDPPLEDVIASLFALSEKQVHDDAGPNVAEAAAMVAAISATSNGAAASTRSDATKK